MFTKQFNLGVLLLSLLCACSKENAPKAETLPTTAQGSFYALDSATFSQLNAYFIKNRSSLDTTDFMNRVKAAVSFPEKKTTFGVDDDTSAGYPTSYYTSGTDAVMGYGSFVTGPLGAPTFEGYQGDILVTTYPVTVTSILPPFTTRQNQVMADIPYIMTVYQSAGQWVIASIAPGRAAPQIRPIGGGWGVMTLGANSYVAGNVGTNQLNAHAEAQEERTEVFSTTGTAKISPSIDLGAFKMGAEFGVGFTVQSAQNIYNQYTMDAQMNIYLAPWNPSQPNEAPIPSYLGGIGCTDAGILRNE